LVDRILEFLLKYPLRVFEQGTLVWQSGGAATVIIPAVAVVGLVAVSAYRRPAAQARPIDRVVLTLLRLMAFAVLAFCFLRPGLLVSMSVPQRNALGILLDDSKSTLIRDADSLTRLEQIRGIFGDSTGDLISRLSERFVLRFYRFSEGLERIAGAADLTGQGGRTDLATALAEVRRDFAGTPLAGLVVATDGADNGGHPISDPLLTLRAAKIPVFTVGIGRERFERDVAIDRVEVPRSTLRGAVLLGNVAVRARGVAGQELALTVEDGGRIVATRAVMVPRGVEVVTVPIRIPPLEPGVRHLEVSVRPVPGEAVSQNNVLAAQVRVRDRREKVLYLEGTVRPEFAFLRRAAATDSNLQVVGLQRTSSGKFLRLGVDDSVELVRGFPTTRGELFQYRGLLLGTVEASFFTSDQLRMIAEFVGERGGGLLALGGRSSFGEGSYEGTTVADALPVRFQNRQADSAEAPLELKIRPTPVGLTNAALLLTAREDDNPARWDSLPPLTSVNRLGTVKPGATILLEGTPAGGGNPVPVLAFQRYGRGRALTFGVQDSWLWQMHASIPVEDQTHETLWRQLIRWLLEDVPDRLNLTVSPERPVPGERVTLRAELADSGFNRVNDAAVLARITSPDGSVDTLALDWSLGQDGVYAGSFVASGEGRYRVELEAHRGRDTLRIEPEQLEVADRGADFLNAEMRSPLLKRIAEETGGRFYTAATVGKLPDDVVYTESGVTVRETRDLWDMPVVFLALMLLLGAEWVYRRRRGLV
jgi:uncharacterized membrane protein